MGVARNGMEWNEVEENRNVSGIVTACHNSKLHFLTLRLRNICMRHWNAHQPGGQGLLVDFDKHFKALSSEDKEVWSSSQNTPVNANHSILGHITAFHERTARRSIHHSMYLLCPLRPLTEPL